MTQILQLSALPPNIARFRRDTMTHPRPGHHHHAKGNHQIPGTFRLGYYIIIIHQFCYSDLAEDAAEFAACC